MNGTELRSFSHFLILTWIACSDLRRNLENRLILKFVFIHCKTVKVSQYDQIRMQTWFPSVFLMNGTELRSYSHFQNFDQNAYPDLSRNLQNDYFWSLSSFTVKLWKSAKMIEIKCKLDLLMFPWWMEQNYEVWLIIIFWPGSHLDLSRKRVNWLIFEFSFIHCITVKDSQNDKIRM